MNQLSPLIRILLPAILAYLAFSFLGPVWGIIVLLLLLASVIFLTDKFSIRILPTGNI